ELAVASVGRGNIFGHPSPQTIAMLARRGIPLLRTDRDGTVTIESDGRGWRVVSHQLAARGPPAGEARSKARRAGMPSPAGRINVNTAPAAELEALPGIGAVIARRIIEGRPYRLVVHSANSCRVGSAVTKSGRAYQGSGRRLASDLPPGQALQQVEQVVLGELP